MCNIEFEPQLKRVYIVNRIEVGSRDMCMCWRKIYVGMRGRKGQIRREQSRQPPVLKKKIIIFNMSLLHLKI